MATDQRLTDVVAFAEEFLAADTAVLRAASGEPDDDVYLEAVRRASAFYASSGGLPLGPQAGRSAVPGGTSPQATKDPGERAGSTLFAVARLASGDGWLALVSGAYDTDGGSFGAALLVETVGGELKVTGRADADPFVDGIAWADSGGRPVPVDAPLGESETLRLPHDPEQAAWLTGRLGP
ncbi:hypothetical protein [Cellulomonas sp. Root137]|uniref:hypothetical protein n=1 Tax=Cellulomonas sp. Root137 TaxID=1736459 RepID=UPI0012E3DB1B|nr:hypothetical protein [Cellulomonas sp. Root137]